MNKSKAFLKKQGTTQTDTDEVNRRIDMIRRSRSRRRPKSGDIVETIDRYGKCDPYWHIDGKGRWLGQNIAHCTGILYADVDEAGVVTHRVKRADKRVIWGLFRYMGKRAVRLYIWTHDKRGRVAFNVTVNVWEHRALFPLYGKYNTRDYIKFDVYKLTDRRGHPIKGNKYRYYARPSGFMHPFVFKTRAQYEQWLGECGEAEFEGKYSKHRVVFCDIERTKQYIVRHR
jgi:hypothetical protein